LFEELTSDQGTARAKERQKSPKWQELGDIRTILKWQSKIKIVLE
jgi:hypothetical protein